MEGIRHNKGAIYRIVWLMILVSCILILAQSLFLFDALYIRRARIDDSRMIIQYIITSLQSGFKFSQLWSDVHPAPFSATLYLASYNFESLNFKLWKVFVGFSAVLQVGAYLYLVNKIDFNDQYRKLLAYFSVVIILLSFTTTSKYSWNSVGLVIFYMSFGSLYLIFMFRKLENQVGHYISSFLFIALIVLIAFRSIAIFWFISSLIVLAWCSIVNSSYRKRFWASLTAILIAMLIEKQVFHLIGVELESEFSYLGAITAIESWGSRPLDSLFYVFVSLSNGIVKPSVFSRFGFGQEQIEIVQLLIGGGGIVLLIVSLIKSVKDERYILPSILILFSVLTIIAAMVIRMGEYESWQGGTFWPRYVPLRDVGILGAVLVLLLLSDSVRVRSLKYGMTVLSCVTISAFLVFGFYYRQDASVYANHLESLNQRETEAMIFIGDFVLENPSSKYSEIRAAFHNDKGLKIPHYYDRRINPDHNSFQSKDLIAIRFMRENNLNVFSEDFN